MENDFVQGLSQELREDCLRYSLLASTLLGILLLFTSEGPPPAPNALGLLLLGISAAAGMLLRHRRLATSLLVLGLLATAILAAHWYPELDSHFPFLIPILVATMAEGSMLGLLVAGVSSVILCGVSVDGSRVDLVTLLNVAGLWVITGLLVLSRRPERRMLTWAWQGYADARAALEQARDRQAELKQALEDLALANRETIRLNEMLSAARGAVEEARRAKEDFVANVSHELRTPLNMIIGFSDMILDAPETYSRRLPHALLSDVSVIRRNSQHLAELVDDVLDLSEVDSGHVQLIREPVSIASMVEEARITVGGLFEKKGLTLGVEVPQDLPSIYADRTRLRQVLLNLLSNAARFTEHGGATVKSWVEQNALVISVVDTGLGMGADKLERLFEPFQQGDPSIRRRFGGSGLGLAISKRLVEMHGGRIWLESQEGVGTTASFTLPLDDGLAVSDGSRWFSEYQTYVPRPRGAARPSLQTKPRVIIVERGSAMLRLVERYAEGIEPVAVQTLDEGAYAVEVHAASALIVNETPDDNTETLARLPHMALSVPIVSCWAPEPGPTSKLGVQGYLVKPVSRTALFQMIQQVAPDARTIVLADDDAEARRLFSRMLSTAEQPYVVLHARDGEQALEFLRTRDPDLLLLDLVMPNVDGFEVLRAKGNDSALLGIPVIVLSAKDPEQEPLIGRSVTISRQEGLSPKDLTDVLQAIVSALKPRFGAPEPQ